MTLTSPAAADQRGRSWPWLLIVWLAAALVMASHRPSALLHPVFWAEDGFIWFAQAYRDGPLLPLIRPQDGYLQTFPRLVADLALLAPFHLVPLVMNVAALLVQGLPVPLLVSSRASSWGVPRLRWLLAALYLAVPNSMEWHANTTNTQWVVALLALMVLLAHVPRTVGGRVFDVLVLVLCGLTGPFCILLLPVAGLMTWLRRERWRLVQLALVSGCAVIQSCAIYATRNTSRLHSPTGASLGLLLRILTARVFSGAILGTVAPLAATGLPLLVPALIALACLAFMGLALWKGCLELRLFVLFSAETLAAALHSPMVGDALPRWQPLLRIWGCRYYLFPMLAFLLCIVSMAATARGRLLRTAAIALLCLVPVGAVRNWRDFYPELHLDALYDTFHERAVRFESSPQGSEVQFPENPESRWVLTLVKH